MKLAKTANDTKQKKKIELLGDSGVCLGMSNFRTTKKKYVSDNIISGFLVYLEHMGNDWIFRNSKINTARYMRL